MKLTKSQDANGSRVAPRPTLAPNPPGVTITTDLSNTAPTLPVIRGKIKRQPCRVTPYALVKAALIDLAEGRA